MNNIDPESILAELPVTFARVLRSIDTDKEDILAIAKQLGGMPGTLLVMKGGDGWNMTWWDKFKESMIMFVCSDRKDCLHDIIKNNQVVTAKQLISMAAIYTGAAVGVPAAALTAICGAVLYQVIKRSAAAWCEVNYK